MRLGIDIGSTTIKYVVLDDADGALIRIISGTAARSRKS